MLLTRWDILPQIGKFLPHVRIGPREVTAGWNLRHSALLVADNLPATFGRVHEATFDATVRTPHPLNDS